MTTPVDAPVTHSHAWGYERRKGFRTAFRTCRICGRMEKSQRIRSENGTVWSPWSLLWLVVPGFVAPADSKGGQ